MSLSAFRRSRSSYVNLVRTQVLHWAFTFFTYECLQGERLIALRILAINPASTEIIYPWNLLKKATRLKFDSQSLTIYDLAARPFGN
jgi:hypothetical protein